MLICNFWIVPIPNVCILSTFSHDFEQVAVMWCRYVETRLSIEQFIKNSRKKPKYDKYIITQAPDEMVRDFEVPSFHLCGKRGKHDLPDGQPWMTQMYENNFWYVQVPEDEIASSVRMA